MSTAINEMTFRSKGCSLKSDEFVAIMKLKDNTHKKKKEERGQLKGEHTNKKKKAERALAGAYIAMGRIVKNFLLFVN